MIITPHEKEMMYRSKLVALPQPEEVDSLITPLMNDLPIEEVAPIVDEFGHRGIPAKVVVLASTVNSLVRDQGAGVTAECPIDTYNYHLRPAITALSVASTDDPRGVVYVHRIAEEKNLLTGHSTYAHSPQGLGHGPLVGGARYAESFPAPPPGDPQQYCGFVSWVLAFSEVGSSVVPVTGDITAASVQQLLYQMWAKSWADPDKLYLSTYDRDALSKEILSSPYYITTQGGTTAKFEGLDLEGYRVSRIINRVTGSEVQIIAHPYFKRGLGLAVSTKLPYWYADLDLTAPATLAYVPGPRLFRQVFDDPAYQGLESRRELVLRMHLPGCFGLLQATEGQ